MSQLFDAATGVLVCPIDEGAGHRQKPWEDEIPHWIQEWSTTLGKGRLANFPGFLNGDQMGVKPLGESYSQPKNPDGSTFAGVTVYEAVEQTAVLAAADGSAVTFGDVALTTPATSSANYRNTNCVAKNPPAPRGGQAPAFIVGEAQTYDLTGKTVLTIIVNGISYPVTITAVNIAAVTAQEVITAIVKAGVPVDSNIVSNTPRLWAPGVGLTTSIQVPASSAGAVVFATNKDTVFFGSGGPLGQRDNTGVVNGAKPQRPILPGSIKGTLVVGAETITFTDGTITSGLTGVLAGLNAAGTVTVSGTINYATGAIHLASTTAPDNSTNVQISWQALVPLTLANPVRVPRAGRNYAIALN